MLQAQLRGKLTRGEEDMEDLLTSNVFGSIKYVAPQEGLGLILASSEDMNGNRAIDSTLINANVHYEFWPPLDEPNCNACEPDVLIRITLSNSRRIMLLVEAKYHSDKSSFPDDGEAPNDQLACEFDNLSKKSRTEKADPILLYVTADLGFPKDSVEESQREFLQKRKEKMNIYWISWRRIPGLFDHAERDSILYDLVRVLQRLRLTFYEGIKAQALVPVYIDWSFRAIVSWNWASYEDLSIHWKFGVNKRFIWKYHAEPINWRLVR